MSQQPPPEKDLIDQAFEIPIMAAAKTRLQAFVGPSCLIAMIIFALLVILFKRWVHLPPVGLLILLLIIWGVVLGVGIRFRNDDPDRL